MASTFKMGASSDQSVWVPEGAKISVLSPNDHPDPSHMQQREFGKSHILNTKQPKKRQFGAFGRAHGLGYVGLLATTFLQPPARAPPLLG